MRLRRFLYPFLMLTATFALLYFSLPNDVNETEPAQAQSTPAQTQVSAASTVPETGKESTAAVVGSTARSTAASAAAATTASTTTASATVTAAAAKPVQGSVSATTAAVPPKDVSAPLRAVWVSFIEIPKATVTQEKYTAAADDMFAAIAKAGFNAAFVHVRPFADSTYPSKLFPWAKLLTGTQGKAPAYDPLAILLQSAKKHGVQFHAWLNPFRVKSDGTDETTLSADNPARKWLSAPDAKAKGLVVKTAGGIYFNPAAPEVHALIYSGVREILRGYDVDGIHLDDYFYPSQDVSIDSIQYNSYKRGGGTLTPDNWRRASINTFVAGLYQTIKSENPSVVFSISPGGNMQRNYNSLYADVACWVSTPGYVDMIIPQLYYGFENQSMPFEKITEQWNDLVTLPSVKLALGLAVYKAGENDRYAGRGGQEWQNNSNIIARQAAFAQSLNRGIGLALYSYAYVFGNKETPAVSAELAKLYAGGVWRP